jgi:hypothetical protein
MGYRWVIRVFRWFIRVVRWVVGTCRVGHQVHHADEVRLRADGQVQAQRHGVQELLQWGWACVLVWV